MALHMVRILLVLVFLVAPWSDARGAGTDVATRPFLWKLETDTATAYFFGALHAARSDIYPLPASVYKAYDRCDRLVVEANPLKMKESDLARMMMVKALRLDGESYKTLLDKGTYKKLARVAKRHGMSPESLDRLKPWYVGQLLALLEMKRLGIDPEYGIDRHFIDRAGSDKPILELEGIEKQLAFLDSFSDEEEWLMLEYTLRDLENLEEHMNDMTAAWKTGDAAKLDDLLTGYLDESPGLEAVFDRLFKDRNQEMIERVKALLKHGGTYFVVVGAGHLVAQDGIIQTLEAQGFDVSQVE